MYESLKQLDSVRIHFDQAGINTINIVLALIMFGVALGISTKTFKEIFIKPKSIIVGLCLQWFALPAVTFLLITILRDYITFNVAMGMILVASCPGGNISNFMSSYAKANTELSVSMTAIATILATFITPINFSLWGGLYHHFVMSNALVDVPTLSIGFWPMFKQVLILLGIPIICGMLFSYYFKKISKKMIKPFQILSLIFFIALVFIAFKNNYAIFVKYLFIIFFLVLIHNLLAMSTGYLGAAAFKLPKKDRRTLCIEVGIQNSGLGLVLLFNPAIFPQENMGGMLIITAWWGIWHIISGLTISTIFRHNRHKKMIA
ncbi:MAG: bile acid:sodium symporter family protein [Bacteroidales bacterium]